MFSVCRCGWLKASLILALLFHGGLRASEPNSLSAEEVEEKDVITASVEETEEDSASSDDPVVDPVETEAPVGTRRAGSDQGGQEVGHIRAAGEEDEQISTPAPTVLTSPTHPIPEPAAPAARHGRSYLDDPDQIDGVGQQGIGVLQEHRARGVSELELHRRQLGEHLLHRTKGELRSLVDRTKRTVVPGAVTRHAHQQGARLGGRANGPLFIS